MSKRVMCKFFSHGACLKGEFCDYSHDWKAPQNNVCTFYQKGMCAYGSRCRYEHVKAPRRQISASSSSANAQPYLTSDAAPLPHPLITSSGGVSPLPGTPLKYSASKGPFIPSTKSASILEAENPDCPEDGDVTELRSVHPADRSICSFAAAGNCPRGEKCPHIHGDLCPNCGKHCLHPFRPEEKEEHMKTCERKQNHLEALKQSQDIECSVCLERVLSKPTLAEQKFGLLSECDHPFCIACIRNWRGSSPTSGMDVNNALRACPICRKLSYFVVPSLIWYSTKEEKEEIVNSYKAKLRSIDCKHFKFGDGNCPFGTSCFYKHTVKPGSYTWKYNRPPPRRPPPRRSNVVDINAFSDMVEDLEELGYPNFEDLDCEDYTLGDLDCEDYTLGDLDCEDYTLGDLDNEELEYPYLADLDYEDHTLGDLDYDDYALGDLDNEDVVPLDMALLLMQLGYDSADSSSNEEIHIS